MAEAIFKDLAKDVEVSSAGLYADEGSKASFEAVEVCKNHGLDLSGHRSTSIGNANVEEMDFILTAQESHRNDLKKLYPQLKIKTIKECAEGYDDLDITDPYKRGMAVYENCFLEIREALEKIYENRFLKKSP